MIKFRCEACGQKLGVAEQFTGKRVKCTRCGEVAKVPDLVAAAADSSDNAFSKMIEDIEPVTAPPPASRSPFKTVRPEAPAATANHCPKCGHAMNAGAVICLGCGHNVKLGVNATTLMAGRKAAGVAGAVGKSGLAMLGGATAAVVGGAIWAGIVVATGYEIGYVAWGIGLLVGLVVVTMSPQPTPVTGTWAAGLALVGLVIGKLLIFQWGMLSIGVTEVMKDPDLVRDAVTAEVIEDPVAMMQIATKLGVTEVNASNEAAIEAEVRAEADRRLRTMSQEQKKEAVTNVMRIGMAEIPMSERVTGLLSPWDALWGFLMLGTAFKVGSGAGSES